MADSVEELEPLFDYSRVQPDPLDVVFLDEEDSSPVFLPKRRKFADSAVGVDEKTRNVIQINDSVDEEEEEDWMPPPPKIVGDRKKLAEEDATIRELRIKKQELASIARSAEDVMRAVEDSVRRDFSASMPSSSDSCVEKPPKPTSDRAKIVISVQDKSELRQFRIYKDDKFERLFKLYANKVKLNLHGLVFSFDGERINPTATPQALGMENDDVIEVHVK